MNTKCILALLLLFAYPHYNLENNDCDKMDNNIIQVSKIKKINKAIVTPTISDDYGLTEITNSINKYKTLYPDYTDQQIIDIVYEETYSDNNYGSKINETEFRLIFDNLGILGFFTIKNIRDEVLSKEREYYGYNGNNNDGDAFRHLYLACTLYKEVNKTFALDLLIAHEEGQNGLSSKMDLHNDSRGLYLYELWNSKYSDTYSMAEFIHNCVKNGKLFNIVKLDNVDEELATDFVYTTEGNDIPAIFENECKDITSKKYSTLTALDYHWYKYSSENKSGEYKIYSSSNMNLNVEIYSSIDNDYVLKSKNITGDFSISIDLTYYESIYLKVYGLSDVDEGNYFLNIEEIKTTEAPVYTYKKYNKKKHMRIGSDGTTYLELHAVSPSANGATNCLLCGQSLDTRTDGPFIVAYSENYISNLRSIKDEYNLSKEDWEKYVYGIYFSDDECDD